MRTHVEAAERAALEGHMEKATEELRKALHIDPGNTDGGGTAYADELHGG